MGIGQLTSLIKYHVPDGYKDVDLVEECQNYQRKFNRKPQIVIDLHGLLRLIKNIDLDTNSKNEELANLETLCGGRFPKYQMNCEYLFELLSSHADLVFFVDGSIVVDKLDHWMKDNEEKYHKTLKITEMICEGEKLTEITKKVKKIPGSSSHLKIVEAAAKEYGKLQTSTRECDSEIAKYANENNALAVLAEDSDFLIFKGDWRYFSIDDMNISTLTSKEFNKKALWKFLKLKNFYQMAILATIAGNDLVDYNEVEECHKTLIEKFKPQGEYLVKRFKAIAEFVRRKTEKRKAWKVVEIVADAIDSDDKDRLRPMIKKSIEMYHTNFQDPPANNLEKFCIDNGTNFVYNLITGKVIKYSVHYYDLRENEPNLFESQMKIFTRQNGIIFKEMKESIEYEVVAKTKHDEPFGKYNLKHEHPKFEIPPLLELLDAENHPQHEELRWKILKWLIK